MCKNYTFILNFILFEIRGFVQITITLCFCHLLLVDTIFFMFPSLVYYLLWFRPSSTSAFYCGSIPRSRAFFVFPPFVHILHLLWFHSSSASVICFCCGFIARLHPLFVGFHPSSASILSFCHGGVVILEVCQVCPA